ncbi:hypothetical protein [Neobacillus massiliamazoniensis]|uniref:Uncharacterized protein n=1 Tax=Neobacillus massiliamazoniensis TaxID=1499688 RepID=A0A0U1P422_9BACI|nr:hypothetical protein [Neobacillus massiliamazoniensis]CRK84883.1 hypothetical protein BN000_04938 [Neobacillus massiliamazoniensis]
MTQAVSIEVDLETLEKTNDNIVGNICFVNDYHRFFPAEGWSDLVIIVLSWWIESLKGLIISEAGRVYKFDFMDGTPVVFGKKTDSDKMELSFFGNSERGSVEYSSICSISELKASLLSTSKKVLRSVERNKWSSEEIDKLKDLVLSLERYPNHS